MVSQSSIYHMLTLLYTLISVYACILCILLTTLSIKAEAMRHENDKRAQLARKLCGSA